MGKRLALLVFLCALGAQQSESAPTVSDANKNWPGWRGPRGDGTSDETGIPLRWSSTENVTWKVPIPGKGHSSPVIWGERIFVTSCIEEEKKRMLYCLDRRTGEMKWERHVLTADLERKHGLNSYASSTPATDGKHVWVSFLDVNKALVACYDMDGKEVWRKEPGKFSSVHGFCSPPTLYKNLVILNGDHDGDGYLVALDKMTGDEKWRTDRPNKTRSYCPPLLIDAAGKRQLVLSGSKCVASYDPDTGKEIWILDGPTEQFVASLVFNKEELFLTCGYPEHHLMAIKPDGMGNVTKSAVVWHEETGDAGYVPSPIAFESLFFVVNDAGHASCYDAKSGEKKWGERLGKHHSASPVSAEGRLYFLDDNGRMWVLKAGDKFEVLAKNDLGEECYASPAIAQGQIVIRGLHNLYCIGKSEQEPKTDR
jgi:outer membrane protein assembly factor BamB